MRFTTILALCGFLAAAATTNAQPVTARNQTNTPTSTASLMHSTPTTETSNLQERYDDPDGSFFPETKNICLTLKGTRYKAQKFCHQRFTSFWQSGAYFAYKAEFDDYRAAHKNRAHDGKFVEEKICGTYAEKWVVEECKYGSNEGRYYCCDVRRLRGRNGETHEIGGGKEEDDREEWEE